jgi:hypothetical protein
MNTRIPLLLLLSIASIAHATTYYVDYTATNDSADGITKSSPWKRCPGMIGYAGTYNHAAGDVFVFKGGVTWPAPALPLTIGYGGTAGHTDTYTVDPAWYSGAAYSSPVFDGQQSLGQFAVLIFATGKSHLLINGLRAQNVGSPVDGSGTAIEIFNGSYIEVSHCWLQPAGIQAFAYDNDAGMANAIYFHDNHIAKAGRFVIYGEIGAVTDDVRVFNNVMEGPGNMFLGNYHEDGLMIGCPVQGSTTYTVTNILFYNNSFIGDWSQGATALYYSNGWTNHTKIFNNVFAFEQTSPLQNVFSPAFVDMGNNDADIAVYNNTFASDNVHGFNVQGLGATNGVAVFTPTARTTVVVENNLFSMTGIDINMDTSTGAVLTADYNLHYPDTSHWGDLLWVGATQYKTLADARTAGYENHSPAMAAPKFISAGNGTTGSANWALQPGSPAIGAGMNLNSVFTTDILGATRDSTWDVGAYRYHSASVIPPANATTSISVQ